MRHPVRVGNNRQRLGNLVKAWRVQLGMLSQEALSTASGVAIRTIGKLERGEPISPTKMRQLETALGKPPFTFDEILDGRGASAAEVEPWAAALVAMSDGDLERVVAIVEAYRPGEGEKFRMWARGVRDAAAGRGIEPRNSVARDVS